MDFLDKVAVKRLTVQNLGKRIDERLEVVKNEAAKLEGLKSFLQAGGLLFKGLDGIKSHWKRDLEAHTIEKEQADAAIKAIDQCLGIVRNLYEKANVDFLVKQGEVRAYTADLDLCDAVFQEEGKKAEAAVRAAEVPQGEKRSARPIGVRPGQSEAQKRKRIPKKKITRKKKRA
jgi:hypothetical protein